MLRANQPHTNAVSVKAFRYTGAFQTIAAANILCVYVLYFALVWLCVLGFVRECWECEHFPMCEHSLHFIFFFFFCFISCVCCYSIYDFKQPPPLSILHVGLWLFCENIPKFLTNTHTFTHRAHIIHAITKYKWICWSRFKLEQHAHNICIT